MKEGTCALVRVDVMTPEDGVFMFTGIITHQGSVRKASEDAIEVAAPRTLLRRLAKGGSVAVDGVCLTVVSRSAGSFAADLMSETVVRTTLGGLSRGASVNLELPATPMTFLSGHIVQGHVDGTGKVTAIRTKGSSAVISVTVPRSLMRGIVPKGSVTMNGVSLTVIGVSASGFSVGIIPHTGSVTTFGRLKPGDRVNIETDILAKYVEKLITHKKRP